MLVYYSLLIIFFSLFFKSVFVFVGLNRALLYLSLIVLFSVFYLIIFNDIINKNKVTVKKALVLVVVLFLTVYFLISFVNEHVVSIKSALESYLVLVFPFLVFYLTENLKIQLLIKLRKKIILFILILVFFSLLEFVTPNNLIMDAASKFLTMKTGIESTQNAYLVRGIDLNILRSGSILFEPVTYSLVCLLGLTLITKYRIFTLLSLISTLGKSAIFGFIISIIMQFSKKTSLLTVFVFIIVVSVFLVNIDYVESITPPSSMGLHLLGLINGIHSIDGNLFIGHGIGSAGYGPFLEAKKIGTLSDFFDVTITAGVSNGNESFIGVLLYQLGLLLTVFYLLPFSFALYVLYSHNLLKEFSILFVYFMFSFLTETVSSILLLSLVAFILSSSIRLKSYVYER